MATPTIKQNHIGVRVPQAVYEWLCHAADLSGATANQFLVQSPLMEAQPVIEREQVIRLSARDWDWMLNLLDNPPESNAKSKVAMDRYQKAKIDDAVTSFSWQP
jgi:uncharacterized protein (DUF1778 family)